MDEGENRAFERKANDRRKFQRSDGTVNKRGVLKEFNVNKGAQTTISPSH